MIELFLPAARHHIADADIKDVDDLAEIHRAAFPHGWSGDEFAALLRQENVFGLIMRRQLLRPGSQPVGFVLIRIAADEAEMLTLAVLPSRRRRGVGGELAEEAMRRLYREGARSVFLEVDEGNEAALVLYRRLGFETVGTRSGYYVEAGARPGNALVMRRQLR